MPISNCRVCGQKFYDEPLLVYKNMPRSAQYLPTGEELSADKGIDLEVCQCSGCGLVQLSNDPVSYYREVIRASSVSEEMRLFRYTQFSEFIERYDLKGKKIVEIGCGKGEYMDIMIQCDIDVYGIEYSDPSVSYCQSKGFRVIRSFIDKDNQSIQNGPFDSFISFNYLEHMPDPNSVLRGINNNLISGAVGLVEVPNLDMILRDELFSEFISDHLLYFTKDTLDTFIRLNGFDVVDIQEIWHNYILSCTVKKRPECPLSFLELSGKAITLEIDSFIREWRANGKTIALWGAGHQALMVLSLLELSDCIEYVVDSAAFKQNKFTPVTHLPIVSPAKLDTEPVDIVIVMAASYSDEVARIIRNRFPEKIVVAVLRNFGLEILGNLHPRLYK